MSHTELIARLRAESDELIKYQFSHTKEAMSCLQRLHDLSLEAADALQALEPDDSGIVPDSDKVICPGCSHQFTAIPGNVQARLQAMERVPMTESGWLIECNIASGAPFWLKPDGDGTNDSNEALRFSRATDAQGFLDSFLVAKYGKDTMGIFKRHYSKEKYSVTEHMWLDSKSDKGPQ